MGLRAAPGKRKAFKHLLLKTTLPASLRSTQLVFILHRSKFGYLSPYSVMYFIK
jgi:hypothetical protein